MPTATASTINTQNIQTTKVFMNGRSQAVRIPADFRFEEEEVFVNRIGNTLMLTPKSALAASLRQGAALIDPDFMEEGLPEEIPSAREEL